jgi:PKD repeat protein
MKTKLRLFLSVFAVVLVLSACKKAEDPATVSQASADFAYDTSVNKTVQFQNLSRNYTSLTWDFGDGQSSTEVFPKHVYANTGTVTVTLKVKGGNEATSSKSVIVK